MGRNSCCVKQKLRKGLWSPEEDEKLYHYITRFGVGCWSSVPKLAGLKRCGKSCRLRWFNYLRPDLKRGMFSREEEDLILNLHEALGNRWAQIAAQLPGRTDNEIKNFWNSSLKKKLLKQGVDPNTHKPIKDEGECCADLQQQTYTLIVAETQTKQVCDPLFLSEFQANVDPCGFQSISLSHCHQTRLRPYEHDHDDHHHLSNPICGCNSMPSLSSFDHQNMPQAQYSHLPSSRMTTFAMNEARESSNVSFQQQAMMQISNNVREDGGAFSWDDESKLDSVFQFEFGGIQIEERDQKLQNQSSDDFAAAYSLTANMNVFDHRIQTAHTNTETQL